MLTDRNRSIHTSSPMFLLTHEEIVQILLFLSSSLSSLCVNGWAGQYNDPSRWNVVKVRNFFSVQICLEDFAKCWKFGKLFFFFARKASWLREFQRQICSNFEKLWIEKQMNFKCQVGAPTQQENFQLDRDGLPLALNNGLGCWRRAILNLGEWAWIGELVHRSSRGFLADAALRIFD
jgi:hypothetical protein